MRKVSLNYIYINSIIERKKEQRFLFQKKWKMEQNIQWLWDNYTRCESHLVMSDSLQPHGLYSPWNSPGQNIGVGSLFFFQGIFPNQGSNPGLPHCRWILYQLSHKGSPRGLEWVAYPFSSGSSQPRSRTRVSFIAGRFLNNWAIRKALICTMVVVV